MQLCSVIITAVGVLFLSILMIVCSCHFEGMAGTLATLPVD